MMKKLLNNKGMGIAESLVGLAILGTVLSLYVGSSKTTSDLVDRAETQTVMQKYMQAYIESMTGNIGYYQINFKGDETFENETDPEKVNPLLPLAWNNNVITSVEECEKCKGRMGFMVIPYSNDYRGLYEVVFRTSHPELQNGSIQTFRFVVSAN